MFVRPAEGRAVRDPDTRVLLSASGEEKPDTRFWRRRVRDKDVEEVERPTEAEARPKAEEVKPADPTVAAGALYPGEQAATPAEEH